MKPIKEMSDTQLEIYIKTREGRRTKLNGELQMLRTQIANNNADLEDAQLEKLIRLRNAIAQAAENAS